MNQLRFTLTFFVYAVCLGMIAFILNSVLTADVLVPGFWLLFGIQAALTLFAGLVSLAGIKKGGAHSVFSIMGAITVRLLLTMILAMVYLMKINVNKVIFIIDFISIYFFFSAFEIWVVLAKLRHQNKSG